MSYDNQSNACRHSRRTTVSVHIGDVVIGSGHPVALQSMTNTLTMDTEASVEQSLRIAEAGGEIVRLTAPGSREAANIGVVRRQLRARGCSMPVVADIHFNPKAAMTAAECCDKVRINPGNFVDPGRRFAKLDYTDQEYAEEIEKIDRGLTPLLELLKSRGAALRIGVNHGSLSDRIMSRYGDTPAGMVESAMEFLRVCVKRGFTDVVISIKASNVRVMVETTRRLVDAMERESMSFPLHLGVTEAGDGEDARIKSAVGIGTLLAQGIGDTVRVSLSEPPEDEIPVARAIVDYATATDSPEAFYTHSRSRLGEQWVAPERRRSEALGTIGGSNPAAVVTLAPDPEGFDPDRTPDLMLLNSRDWIAIDSPESDRSVAEAAEATVERIAELSAPKVVILNGRDNRGPEWIVETTRLMESRGIKLPVVAAMTYDRQATAGVASPREELTLRAAIDLGRVLMAGVADGIMIITDELTPRQAADLCFGILQSTRLRMTRTEYISCPGCGRTLYDLASTLRSIKEATSQLKGLKIGVMGCIVNGPGEMADADYGYVGAGPGRVSLYKGKECVVKNIPASEAVDRLVALIKENGDWR